MSRVLRSLGAPMPACAVTLGGWFDLEASGESATRPVGRELFASPEFLRARGRDYVGPKGSLRDPLASPIHADLEGLPVDRHQRFGPHGAYPGRVASTWFTTLSAIREAEPDWQAIACYRPIGSR